MLIRESPFLARPTASFCVSSFGSIREPRDVAMYVNYCRDQLQDFELRHFYGLYAGVRSDLYNWLYDFQLVLSIANLQVINELQHIQGSQVASPCS